MKNPSWSYPNSRFRDEQKRSESNTESTISIGGSQSYGDANFNYGTSAQKLDTNYMSYDPKTFVLEVSGSARIKDVLNYLLISSRTLGVVPGTLNATIGGCVASDIHGKNSYHLGTFSSSVCSIYLRNNQESKWIDRENTTDWKSTIGGQGLSGVIEKVRIQTIPIKSTLLKSEIILTKGVQENLQVLRDVAEEHEFAVSWIDGTRSGKDRFGYVEFADEFKSSDEMSTIRNFNLISSKFPRIKLINSFSIGVYSKITRIRSTRFAGVSQIISRWSYLFPNINLGKWNRLFGMNGFHEVQFLCPYEKIEFAEKLISKICNEQKVFLIGIKALKTESEGYLSFSGNGYSVAVNFAANKESESYVENLYSEIVRDINSRIYLTKDWVLKPESFQEMYPS